LAFLEKIIQIYQARSNEMAEAISLEMGCAPITLSKGSGTSWPRHISQRLRRYCIIFNFEDLKGSTLMRKEPIGVCGLITPWNWPMNQIVCKVAPALAPVAQWYSSRAKWLRSQPICLPRFFTRLALPPGVFNLVNGDGPTVGAAIASHPDVAWFLSLAQHGAE